MRALATHRRRLLAAVVAIGLFAAGCGGTDSDTTSDDAEQGANDGAVDGDATGGDGTDVSNELAVAVASFDIAVGDDQRLMTGLLTSERELIGHGEVSFELGHLGEDATVDDVELTQSATASFLPIPGMEPEEVGTTPAPLGDPDVSGVYAAQVSLDQPGVWQLKVVANLEDGREMEGDATFVVLEAPLVPAVGDEAPRSENLTVDDLDRQILPMSLDSRLQDPGGEVPDPHMHQRTVASSIEEGRPVVVMVSTPVYCVSRFCGPLTDEMSDLATEYEDRVDVVHIEVWKNFEAQELNNAAAEWIQTEQGGNEPWVFLVDAEGTVAARWDNVLDIEELRAELDALPALSQ